MRPPFKSSLVYGAPLFAVCVVIALVWQDGPSVIGFPGQATDKHDTTSFVHLIVKEFRPAGPVLAGSAAVEIYPDVPALAAKNANWVDAFKRDHKTIALRLYHYAEKALYGQGGSDDVIPTSWPPLGVLSGKGTFSWTAKAVRGPFLYPFDSYELYANPELLRVTDEGAALIFPLDTFDIDFGLANMSPRLIRLPHEKSEDPYRIDLHRPPILIGLAIIGALLLGFWLVHLIWSAKAEESAGNVVGIFVGVFSIRSSLLAGAPVFPGLVDYCALAVYLSAVMIILIKFATRDRLDTKECAFCASKISEKAQVCPHCTQSLTENPIGH